MSEFVHFIASYGVVVVFLGCLLEGETAAMAGGFLAHQNVLALVPAFVAAFSGALTADIGFFFIGRRMERTAFVQSHMRNPAFSHARDLVRRHPYLFVLSNRFIYGLRTVGGLAAGMSGLRVPVFLLLSTVSALAWAATFTAIGWTFGIGAERTIRHLLTDHPGFVVLGLAILASAGAAGVIFRFKRRPLPPASGPAVG